MYQRASLSVTVMLIRPIKHEPCFLVLFPFFAPIISLYLKSRDMTH
uniref:Uncharacterized protein n=1 Tax=Anguilla anguilla TaxID=7936 RepID=A0A0E9T983_ANGAN